MPAAGPTRTIATPAETGRQARPSRISDARELLSKDKPAFQQLSNHNTDIGNTLTLLSTAPVVASPIDDSTAAAASASSATQTMLSQPGTAMAAQANISASHAQRILS